MLQVPGIITCELWKSDSPNNDKSHMQAQQQQGRSEGRSMFLVLIDLKVCFIAAHRAAAAACMCAVVSFWFASCTYRIIVSFDTIQQWYCLLLYVFLIVVAVCCFTVLLCVCVSCIVWGDTF